MFQQGYALDDKADLFSQEGLLINAQPLFDSAQVLKKFSISWNLFDQIKQWNVHFDLPQHFRDAFLLRSLLFYSQCLGKWGRHALFHRIFFNEYMFRLLSLMFSGVSHSFGHWLLNFLTTP